MAMIKGSRLTQFEVAPDGRTISIGVADEDARPSALVLPSECLQALLMTLPEMMRQAMQRRYRDPSLRLVYPLGAWQLEASSDPDTLILTLRTSDGFQVSFGTSVGALSDIASAAEDGFTYLIQ